MASARLWVTVEYFHPLQTDPHRTDKSADWDNALTIAIPKIRAAQNMAAYRAAVSLMLDQLHDPETHVLAAGQTAGGSERITVDMHGLSATVRLDKAGTFRVNPDLPPGRLAPANYADAYPSTELRLLAAVKLWGAIHYFFAYKDLMDEDWDDLLPTYLPKFIEARDAVDYNLVMADLLTHLTDTNTVSHSQTLDKYFGEVPVGLRIRLLDHYPIVSDVLDPAASAAGVHPGDVVKRVGGISTTDIFRRLVQYVPASTPQRSGYDTVQKVTNGPPGSEAQMTIENAQGEAHLVTLARKSAPPPPQRSADAVRLLPGNVGYLDLDRIAPDAAAAAMLRLKSAKAIIFDLRGNNAPAAAAIAACLTSERNVAAALVTTPLALLPDIPTDTTLTQTASTFEVRAVPPPAQPHYAGKTLALIDERTIGEAEYAGLLFEAANKTGFVGEPSAGADSRLAELMLPGGITVTYSTQDIRHGNGGKLQRLGLQPNVSAPTTAKGLRAGKDEALDAALAQLAK